MGRLDGAVALVTGAGSGIGLATARALHREGARVALLGRRPEPLEQAAAELPGAMALSADVADAAAVTAAVDTVLQRWDRVDLVVNSAGLNVASRSMASVSVEDWQLVLQANLTGTFLVTRAVLPAMRAQGGGTVVNVSSLAGWRAMALTGPAYSAAKAAVISFTESLNLTERVHGIRATSICPGEVATPILDKRPVPPSAEARASMLQAEDLAATVVFVATLPPRATVELVTMFPTRARDFTAELQP